jgi:hypothetical protein
VRSLMRLEIHFRSFVFPTSGVSVDLGQRELAAALLRELYRFVQNPVVFWIGR